jgi:hypothetical protein
MSMIRNLTRVAYVNGVRLPKPLPPELGPYRVCWADRIGFLWAFLVLGLLALGYGTWSTTAHPEGMPWPSVGIWLKFIGAFVAPPWIILRTLDFVSNGPIRRRNRRLMGL